MLWMAGVLGALVIGEVAAHHALLPVPAAAIGLVAVAAYLWLLGEVPEELARIVAPSMTELPVDRRRFELCSISANATGVEVLNWGIGKIT